MKFKFCRLNLKFWHSFQNKFFYLYCRFWRKFLGTHRVDLFSTSTSFISSTFSVLRLAYFDLFVKSVLIIGQEVHVELIFGRSKVWPKSRSNVWSEIWKWSMYRKGRTDLWSTWNKEIKNYIFRKKILTWQKTPKYGYLEKYQIWG